MFSTAGVVSPSVAPRASKSFSTRSPTSSVSVAPAGADPTHPMQGTAMSPADHSHSNSHGLTALPLDSSIALPHGAHLSSTTPIHDAADVKDHNDSSAVLLGQVDHSEDPSPHADIAILSSSQSAATLPHRPVVTSLALPSPRIAASPSMSTHSVPLSARASRVLEKTLNLSPQITARSVAARITIDDLVADRHAFPLNAAEFRLFLETRHTAEPFDFLRSVRQHRQLGIKQAFALNRLELILSARAIVNTYIAEGSEFQLTISSVTRDALCRAVQTPDISIASLVRLFDLLAAELSHTLANSGFIITFVELAQRNIDDKEITIRYSISAVAITLSVIFSVLIILCTSSRLYRIPVLLVNLWGFGAFWSARCGVCFMLAARKVRMNAVITSTRKMPSETADTEISISRRAAWALSPSSAGGSGSAPHTQRGGSPRLAQQSWFQALSQPKEKDPDDDSVDFLTVSGKGKPEPRPSSSMPYALPLAAMPSLNIAIAPHAVSGLLTPAGSLSPRKLAGGPAVSAHQLAVPGSARPPLEVHPPPPLGRVNRIANAPPSSSVDLEANVLFPSSGTPGDSTRSWKMSSRLSAPLSSRKGLATHSSVSPLRGLLAAPSSSSASSSSSSVPANCPLPAPNVARTVKHPAILQLIERANRLYSWRTISSTIIVTAIELAIPAFNQLSSS